jgi:hypothetical protein
MLGFKLALLEYLIGQTQIHGQFTALELDTPLLLGFPLFHVSSELKDMMAFVGRYLALRDYEVYLPTRGLAFLFFILLDLAPLYICQSFIRS